eukprot:759018-Hanusia_phi.AAC.2
MPQLQPLRRVGAGSSLPGGNEEGEGEGDLASVQQHGHHHHNRISDSRVGLAVQGDHELEGQVDHELGLAVQLLPLPLKLRVVHDACAVHVVALLHLQRLQLALHNTIVQQVPHPPPLLLLLAPVLLLQPLIPGCSKLCLSDVQCHDLAAQDLAQAEEETGVLVGSLSQRLLHHLLLHRGIVLLISLPLLQDLPHRRLGPRSPAGGA